MRAALIQMACREEPEENLSRAVSFIRRAAREGARVICLPELFRSPYFTGTLDPRFFSLAETVEAKSTPVLRKLAAELEVLIISSIFEKAGPGLFYNTAILIDPAGAILGRYRKMHLPLTPSLKEKYYFRPGDLGFPVFETPFGRIGVLICYDRYFPEGFRRLALKGAWAVFVPSACAGDSQQVWELMLKANALAHLVFIGAVNRTGREGETEFYGQSLFASPWGEVLQKAPPDEEEILVADLDPEQVQAARARWPFYRDLRPEAYED